MHSNQRIIFFSRAPWVLVSLMLVAAALVALLGTPGNSAASYGTVESFGVTHHGADVWQNEGGSGAT